LARNDGKYINIGFSANNLPPISVQGTKTESEIMRSPWAEPTILHNDYFASDNYSKRELWSLPYDKAYFHPSKPPRPETKEFWVRAGASAFFMIGCTRNDGISYLLYGKGSSRDMVKVRW
jgi:hypothetical protein